MEYDKLVSVIIPIYNSEKFLKECLDSIVDQTYPNIEIIAIDDGSNDSSIDILKLYSNKIRIFSQKNQGLAASLNLAISKVEGNWVKWFSPDDVMYPNTIETLVKKAEECDDHTIVYSNWNIINESGMVIREFQESNYNELSDFDFNIRLLDGQQINVNTTLIPVNFFKNSPIRKLDDPVAIDYDFFLRSALLFNEKFHLISEPLVKYRVHSDQLSHKNILKTLDFVEEIKKQVLEKLDTPLRSKYTQELKQYQKTKPVAKKSLELGMKIISSTPSWASDRLLTFYLNKIREKR